VRVQVTYVATIHKAVEARKDRGRLLIGNRQCTVLGTRLNAEKLIFDERTQGCFIDLPASERTHGFRALLAFDSARIEPKRFESICGQIGSEEINCLTHLFYQRKLQCSNIFALQQRQYLLLSSKQLLFVDSKLPAGHNHDLDMWHSRRVRVL